MQAEEQKSRAELFALWSVQPWGERVKAPLLKRAVRRAGRLSGCEAEEARSTDSLFWSGQAPEASKKLLARLSIYSESVLR
jgi:hypothetical protein